MGLFVLEYTLYFYDKVRARYRPGHIFLLFSNPVRLHPDRTRFYSGFTWKIGKPVRSGLDVLNTRTGPDPAHLSIEAENAAITATAR